MHGRMNCLRSGSQMENRIPPGVKRIRVHDLRHSHVSLLINMGFTVLAIADRMGHESIDITYRYAHLFPSEQTQMAEQLDIERMEKLNGEKSGQ